MNLNTFATLLAVAAAFPIRADPLIHLIMDLVEHPDLDMAAFEEELNLAFSGLENIERYGTKDLPDGVSDPFYWAVISSLTGDERIGLGACNRLGLGGFDTVSLAVDPWATVESKPLVYGTWPFPLEAFPEDAIARLDCTFNFETKDSEVVDISAIAKVMEPNFVKVKITNGGEAGNIFNLPNQTIIASKGIDKNFRRVERVNIKVNDVGIDINFSVWLLNTQS